MKSKIVVGMCFFIGTSCVWASSQPASTAAALDPIQIQENVRKALVTIPYLSVFDNLMYSVEEGTVTLSGQVTQPYLKDYAEKAVKDVPGVSAINDQIEVLPLSPSDDRIRVQTLHRLERTSSLYRYFMGTQPSIRIIVKNGHVTLNGVVDNAMDRQLALMAANQVPGVFAVTNDLQTQTDLRRAQ